MEESLGIQYPSPLEFQLIIGTKSTQLIIQIFVSVTNLPVFPYDLLTRNMYSS